MTRSAMALRVPLLTAVGLAVLLAGCAGAADPSPSPSPSEETTISEPPASASGPDTTPDPSEAAGDGDPLTGTLGFSDIEGGCPFLRTDDGTHYEVLYPEGWGVTRDPVALVSPEGEVVAEEGDEVTVRGRESTATVSICQIGPIFEASEVVSP